MTISVENDPTATLPGQPSAMSSTRGGVLNWTSVFTGRRLRSLTTEDAKTEIEVPESSTPKPKPDARRRKERKISGVFAGFAAIGTVLAGLTGYWTTYRTVTKEILSPVTPGPIAPRLSVVVLPFSNLTGDAAQDYLGDVITEELTTSLSRIPQSFVIARSTALTFKGKAVDVRQIGRDLGVRYILKGRRAGR